MSIDPEALPREFGAALTSALDDCRAYVDNELAPSRKLALDYYHERGFGTEEAGRSDAVLPIVQSVVMAIQPSIARVFLGSDRTFEFVGSDPVSMGFAKDASDYINDVVLHRDNDGYQVLSTAFADALVQKSGVVTWRWVNEVRHRDVPYRQLTAMEAALVLSQTPGAVVVEQEWHAAPTLVGPDGIAIPVGEPTLDLTLRITSERGRVKLVNVPPEEFLISPSATGVDADDTLYVGRRSYRTVSELVGAGYDREVVEGHAGASREAASWVDSGTRGSLSQEHRSDPSMRLVLVTDGYFRYDLDEDGIAELLHVVAVGEGDEVLSVAPADCVPYAVFCPDPEPHRAIGHSIADQSVSHQYRVSHMLRDVLDSLSQSVRNRLVVVTDQLHDIDEVVDNANGGIIQVRQPGAVQALTTTFAGQQAMPVFEFLDRMHAASTGVTAVSSVDVGDVQSTSAAGINLIADQGSQRVELIIRNLASVGGMKQLARGLLKCVATHQAVPRVAKLPGDAQARTFAPAQWPADDFDVEILVGLGRNDKKRRAAVLREVLGLQRELLTQMPGNPSVNLGHLHNTVVDILDLEGIRDTDRYFAAIPPGWAPPQPQAPQDPAIIEAQANMQASLARTEIERQDMVLRDQRERIKLGLEAQEVEIKRREVESKIRAQIEVTSINQAAETDRHTAQLIADWVANSQQQQAPVSEAEMMAAGMGAMVPVEPLYEQPMVPPAMPPEMLPPKTLPEGPLLPPEGSY